MKYSTLVHAALVITALYTLPTAALAEVIAVQWGNSKDIVGDTTVLGRPATTFDFARYWSPTPGVDYYPNAEGYSPDFYVAAGRAGGVHAVKSIIANTSGGDYIRYRVVAETDHSGTAQMHTMTMWKSDDFLARGRLSRVSHGGNASFPGGTGSSALHFIVQTADSNFYASQDIGFGGKLDVSTATWHDFTGLIRGEARIGNAVGAIDVSAENVAAVGFYAVNDTAGSPELRQITRFFQVEVIPEKIAKGAKVDIPEPECFALIGGCLALAWVIISRRGGLA
ncbi:MAG: hypothetical protein ACPGES_03650 [Coraliomargarita sp.]